MRLKDGEVNLKIKANSILFYGVLSLMIGCYPPRSPDVVRADYKLDPTTEELLNSIKTCNKSDSELSLTQLDPKSAIVVNDIIENKDIVNIDCDKKETPVGRGPTERLSQIITVEAAPDLKEKVNYVIIENPRTCSIQNVGAIDDMNLEEKEIPLEGGNPLTLPRPTETTLGFSGKLKVLLSDSEIRLSSLYLNVRDNNNILSIKYYGKCLKYKEKIDEKLGDSYNCVEAELLAQKEFLLLVKVDRPYKEEPHFINTCTH